MAYDPASFDPQAVLAVYPPGFRLCWFGSKSNAVDPHHCFGRRPPRGFSRHVMSSILNLAWLGRDIHNGPARDDYRIRDYLLERAAKNVQMAVIEGRYQYTEIDEEFKRMVQDKRILRA